MMRRERETDVGAAGSVEEGAAREVYDWRGRERFVCWINPCCRTVT